MKYKVFMKS